MALVGAALQRSHLVLMRAGCYRAPMLFQPPHEELSDADIMAVLCEAMAMAGAGRLPRSADVYLAGICAEHLVDRLRAAGLQVIRPVQWQAHR
jgi:hypothetical protein